MKVLTLIKAKSNVLLDTCNAVPACEDRKPKYWIEFDVVTSHRQTRHLEYGL